MKPRCVVLDGATVTAHGLSNTSTPEGEPTWSALEDLVELTVHARTSPAETREHACEAELVLTNKVVLGETEIRQLPKLRYIGVLATGTNVVDLGAARSRGIVVTNVPGYATESVVAQVFGLLLDLALAVGEHARAVESGQWVRSPDFSFRLRPTYELAGKTLGIVGLGAIGRRVAIVAAAFGMRVLAAHSHRGTNVAPEGLDVAFTTLDELFAQSDVITLHCPLTAETRHLVDARRLALMKPEAWLINTGRGPLVDEVALADVLRRGRIAGAGLDVLSTEPPDPANPLLCAPRCVITPHMGWATLPARQRLMTEVTKNVASFLANTPTHQVGL